MSDYTASEDQRVVSLRVARAALLLWGVVLDPLLIVAWQAWHRDGAAALLMHFAGTFAVMLPGLHAVRRSGDDRRQYATLLQLGVWTALLGPFGTVIGMTLFVPIAGGEVASALPQPALPADKAGAPRHQALHHELLDQRLRLGGGHVARPLLDVVIEGTTADKLDALGLIAKRYVPTLAPALKRALQDGDGSVRVLAATVMAQLHNGHTKRIGKLQESAQAVSTSAAWRALAEARQAYAASGLLDADRANRETQQGQECLDRADALDVVPAHPCASAAPDDRITIMLDATGHAA